MIWVNITDLNGELFTWTNKLDSSVKLQFPLPLPAISGLLKGLPAIDFDAGEFVNAQKNDSTSWSALSETGAVSGQYTDTMIFIVFQVDTLGRTPGHLGSVGEVIFLEQW